MNEFIIKQQRKFEDYAEIYRRETNEVFRELNKQLILFATAVLSISLFVFRSDIFLGKISVFDKHALAFIWILLGVSILSSILQFFIDYFFFKKWTKAKFSIVEGIAQKEIDEHNISSKVIEKQRDIPQESLTIPIYLESISVVIALFLIVTLMIKFVFSV